MPPCNAGEGDAVGAKSSQAAVSKSRHVASRRLCEKETGQGDGREAQRAHGVAEGGVAAPVPVGVPAEPVAETGVEATGAVVVGATVARVLLA